jgi:signal transduction histidine kinase
VRGALQAIGAGPGRIAISGVRRSAGARIEVSDTGPPLDHSMVADLFEPFARDGCTIVLLLPSAA